MKKLLIVLLVSIPAFALMIRQGMYTTHDFHVFRQHEFDLCAQEGSLPCRWSPDAGYGYGEPMFNFYGQAPYVFGRAFTLLGMSEIDAVKILFILSILLSGGAMYWLAREFSRPAASAVAAILYMLAPYRSVDVWVRGALPEAMSFMLFPLLLVCTYKFLHGARRYLIGFSIGLALLITTHNLSAYMFAPFLGIWILFFVVKTKQYKQVIAILLAGLLSLGLSAFYLLPVIAQNQLITLNLTTHDYFMYAIHFATLSQLFLSRFWGYGGSTWGPNDTMSFAVGHIHWPLALLTVGSAFILMVRKQKFSPLVWLCGGLGFVAILLTHGKSEILWRMVPGMSYVQFPWRFLSQSVLFLSLLISQLNILSSRKISALVIVVAVLAYIPVFRPDIWRTITDAQLFSGKDWDAQRASTIQDYWPSSSPSLPDSPAPRAPFTVSSTGVTTYVSRGAHVFTATAQLPRPDVLVIPQVIFPGWTFIINKQATTPVPYGSLGLASFKLPAGDYQITGLYNSVPIQQLGNSISLLSFAVVIGGIVYFYKHER